MEIKEEEMWREDLKRDLQDVEFARLYAVERAKDEMAEFEQGYAERSGVTVEWLHENNQHAIPCDCGDDDCRGWQIQLALEG